MFLLSEGLLVDYFRLQYCIP